MVLIKSDILFSTAFTKSLAERCLQRMLFVKKVGKRGLNCMFAQKAFCRTLFVKKLGIRDDSSRFAHKERSAERFLCKHAIQTPFSYFLHKERSAERFLCKHAIQTPFFLLFSERAFGRTLSSQKSLCRLPIRNTLDLRNATVNKCTNVVHLRHLRHLRPTAQLKTYSWFRAPLCSMGETNGTATSSSTCTPGQRN